MTRVVAFSVGFFMLWHSPRWFLVVGFLASSDT